MRIKNAFTLTTYVFVNNKILSCCCGPKPINKEDLYKYNPESEFYNNLCFSYNESNLLSSSLSHAPFINPGLILLYLAEH